jgi:small neutral amino acid transporter SnatA (MarC family)
MSPIPAVPEKTVLTIAYFCAALYTSRYNIKVPNFCELQKRLKFVSKKNVATTQKNYVLGVLLIFMLQEKLIFSQIAVKFPSLTVLA